MALLGLVTKLVPGLLLLLNEGAVILLELLFVVTLSLTGLFKVFKLKDKVGVVGSCRGLAGKLETSAGLLLLIRILERKSDFSEFMGGLRFVVLANRLDKKVGLIFIDALFADIPSLLTLLDQDRY